MARRTAAQCLSRSSYIPPQQGTRWKHFARVVHCPCCAKSGKTFRYGGRLNRRCQWLSQSIVKAVLNRRLGRKKSLVTNRKNLSGAPLSNGLLTGENDDAPYLPEIPLSLQATTSHPQNQLKAYYIGSDRIFSRVSHLQPSASYKIALPQSSSSLSGFPPSIPYSEMVIPITLPPPLQNQSFRRPHDCYFEETPTLHQLLLVLALLFLKNAGSPTEKAKLNLIYRYEYEWERSLALRLDALQAWLRSLRRVLTRTRHLHTLSLNDIEAQIQYILFSIGQFATPGSNIPFKGFQKAYPPYRPFGVAASIALICYAFDCFGLQDADKFENHEIWLIDSEAQGVMACQLSQSPLFPDGASICQLQLIFHILQSAFQSEEIRVASVQPQKVCLQSDRDIMRYFKRGFLSLDPLLLPSIATLLLETEKRLDMDKDHLAVRLAEAFFKSSPIGQLDAMFKSIRQIGNSKPERTVVAEMFHIKALRDIYIASKHDNRIYGLVFHVAIEDNLE